MFSPAAWIAGQLRAEDQKSCFSCSVEPGRWHSRALMPERITVRVREAVAGLPLRERTYFGRSRRPNACIQRSRRTEQIRFFSSAEHGIAKIAEEYKGGFRQRVPILGHRIIRRRAVHAFGAGEIFMQISAADGGPFPVECCGVRGAARGRCRCDSPRNADGRTSCVVIRSAGSGYDTPPSKKRESMPPERGRVTDERPASLRRRRHRLFPRFQPHQRSPDSPGGDALASGHGW